MSANSEGALQAAGFSSPQEEALINLMRTADSLARNMQQRLKPFGLTLTQYNVLRILRAARPSGLTCSAIGRRMITPEPDVTRLLNRLKSQELVCQQRDSTDRRIVWSRITPHGLKELSKLDGMFERAPRELLGHLSREEILQLTRLLKKSRSAGAPNSSPAPRNGAEPSLA
jgi:DNA-binding MarR family transcriptional regulator